MILLPILSDTIFLTSGEAAIPKDDEDAEWGNCVSASLCWSSASCLPDQRDLSISRTIETNIHLHNIFTLHILAAQQQGEMTIRVTTDTGTVLTVSALLHQSQYTTSSQFYFTRELWNVFWCFQNIMFYSKMPMPHLFSTLLPRTSLKVFYFWLPNLNCQH